MAVLPLRQQFRHQRQHLHPSFRHLHIRQHRHRKTAQPQQMRAMPAIHPIQQQVFSLCNPFPSNVSIITYRAKSYKQKNTFVYKKNWVGGEPFHKSSKPLVKNLELWFNVGIIPPQKENRCYYPQNFHGVCWHCHWLGAQLCQPAHTTIA